MTLRHRGSPEHRRNQHRTSHRHRIENPVYLINGLFYGAPKKFLGISPRRGTIDGLDALNVYVEVSSESEFVCISGSQKRDHRTHESGTEGICVNWPANQPY